MTMTNLVNKVFGDAAIRTQGEVRAHLTKVLEPVFGDKAADVVDDVADYMGRNVPSLDQQGQPRPLDEPR